MLNRQKPRIKFCGLTLAKDVQIAATLDIHALGFVFYPKSKRYISPSLVATIAQHLPPFFVTVGLFVNAKPYEIAVAQREAQFNYLQLHGDETPEECLAISKQVPLPFIKAIAVTESLDLPQIFADYSKRNPFFKGLLLDTSSPDYGGTGQSFDWDLLTRIGYPTHCQKIILSGGLNASNLPMLLEKTLNCLPAGVDVSSGIELAPGDKDESKMRDFVSTLNALDFDKSY